LLFKFIIPDIIENCQILPIKKFANNFFLYSP